MKSTITKEELEIPAGAVAEVTELLLENEISLNIISADGEEIP